MIIRTIQELLSHKNIETTMTYTHVLNRGGLAVRSPLDSETFFFCPSLCYYPHYNRIRTE